MNRNLFFVLAFLVLAATLVSTANAVEVIDPDITSFLVYVNGEPVWHGWCEPFQDIDHWNCTATQFAIPAVERGSQVVIKAVFDNKLNLKNLDNVIVHAWIRGSGKTIEDETEPFDVYGGTQYIKFLYLSIPENWKTTENGSKDYTLHVEIEGERSLEGATKAEIDLKVQRAANLLEIMSINLKEDALKAGSTLEATVVVKNTGNHEIEDVYVKATIPELGISRTYYLGDLAAYDRDDEENTKAITVSIALPETAEAGIYTLVIEAYNGEVKAKESVGFTVKREITGRVEVVPQTTRANVAPGSSVSYSLIITNHEATTKRITINVLGIEGWATSEITPASFSLAPEESRLVTLTLNIDKNAVAAEHLFTVEINYDTTKQRFNFVANVVGPEKKVLDLKTTLLIIGIVLAAIIVVLLVVLLARKTTEEKPEESYY
ncbi:MAG: hypothetical protein QW585_00585 [Candidatus Pacearchaeota archaeon]